MAPFPSSSNLKYLHHEEWTLVAKSFENETTQTCISTLPGGHWSGGHTVEAQEIAFPSNEIELGGQTSTSTTCLGSEASPIHGHGTPS